MNREQILWICSEFEFGITPTELFSNIAEQKLVRNNFFEVIQHSKSSKKGQANASVAQLVEQGTENPRVVGSIPTGGTTKCGFSSFGRASPCQGEGGGFEPRNPLHKKIGHPKGCPIFLSHRLRGATNPRER